MLALAAVRADDHAHGQRRPVLVGAQRAQVVGDALGQHRHDAVGKIDRIAALERLPVERRAGPHVMRDIGDGDGQDEAARIVGVRVGRRVNRVVMILGVRRIDGDERQGAPVLAMIHAGRPRRLGFGERRGRKDIGNAMRRNGDQADRAFRFDRAESLDDARGRQAEASFAQRLERDEIAFGGVAGHARRHEDFARRAALLDGQGAAAAALQLAIDAEHARLGLVEDFDDAAAIGGIARRGFGVEFDAQQHARAKARRKAAFALAARAAHEDARGFAFLGPFDGLGDQFAVAIALDDIGERQARAGGPAAAMSCGRA